MELVKNETLKIEELDELEGFLKLIQSKLENKLEAYKIIYKNLSYQSSYKEDPSDLIIGIISGVFSPLWLYLLFHQCKQHSILFWFVVSFFVFMFLIGVGLVTTELTSEKLRKDLIHKIDQFEEELFTIDMMLGLIEEIKKTDDEFRRKILLNRLIRLLNDN